MSEQQDYRLKTQYYSPGMKPVAPPKPKKSRNTKKKLLAVVLVIVVLITGGVVYANNRHSTIPHKVQKAIRADITKVTSPKKPKVVDNSAAIAAMGQTINATIASNPGINISVNLIDLSNNDQSEHYGVDQTFQAASTAKILTAEYFLHEVEDGKQSLSETVGGHTAEYELQQMIVVSDDTAWDNLNNLLGYDNLQDYAKTTFGISDYQAYNNSLSSVDIALALQGLYEGKVLNSTNTQLLLSYLKQANYREYIVPAVPEGDTIYHKIGLYQDYVNDAAIITDGDKAFVIVIFTNGNGTYNWPVRATMMQDVTRAALKAYFNQS